MQRKHLERSGGGGDRGHMRLYTPLVGNGMFQCEHGRLNVRHGQHATELAAHMRHSVGQHCTSEMGHR